MLVFLLILKSYGINMVTSFPSQNQPLSSICIHPNGRNVLMHSYKQALSMVDLRM